MHLKIDGLEDVLLSFWDVRVAVSFMESKFELRDMGVSLNGGTPKTPQNDHF